MQIEQLEQDRPGAGTLLVSDEKAGIAVVIDPCEEISAYLSVARDRGLRLAHVFLTHLPAGARRASLEVWRQLGVTVHASSRVSRRQRLEPLLNGSSMRFGSLVLEFRHPSGRSPDGLCILLYELEGGSPRPAGVVTPDYRLVA